MGERSKVVGPLIWVLQGPRAGDNAQARALGELLGGKVELIQLSYNWLATLPNVLRKISFATLDGKSMSMTPPWPEFVIGVGRRMAPILAAIKKRSQDTKIVCIGRPRLPLELFDLVITTPQYSLPEKTNVLELPFPLLERKSVPKTDVAKLEALWRDRPKPWIVAAIGGSKYPLRLGLGELSEFGKRLALLERETGGSVMLFPSPRSRSGSLAAVSQSRGFWRSDQVEGSGSFFPAALLLADICVVTSDSVSMIAEMCATGRKVFVERLPVSPFRVSWSSSHSVTQWLSDKGILQPPRNVPDYIDRLITSGAVQDLVAPRIEVPMCAVSINYESVRERVISLNGRRFSGLQEATDAVADSTPCA